MPPRRSESPIGFDEDLPQFDPRRHVAVEPQNISQSHVIAAEDDLLDRNGLCRKTAECAFEPRDQL